MKENKIIFKLIQYRSQNWRQAVELRENVLRKPLGSSFTKAELEEEKNHFHISGYFENQLVATAVLVPEKYTLKMQRVVVLEYFRNSNIGSKLVSFCEEFGKQQKVETLYCHARDTAVNFYLKNGYNVEGDYFDEDGIPHIKMLKKM